MNDKNIDWNSIIKEVNSLQSQIYQQQLAGNSDEVERLQIKLKNSHAGLLLSIRKVLKPIKNSKVNHLRLTKERENSLFEHITERTAIRQIDWFFNQKDGKERRALKEIEQSLITESLVPQLKAHFEGLDITFLDDDNRIAVDQLYRYLKTKETDDFYRPIRVHLRDIVKENINYFSQDIKETLSPFFDEDPTPEFESLFSILYLAEQLEKLAKENRTLALFVRGNELLFFGRKEEISVVENLLENVDTERTGFYEGFNFLDFHFKFSKNRKGEPYLELNLSPDAAKTLRRYIRREFLHCAGINVAQMIDRMNPVFRKIYRALPKMISRKTLRELDVYIRLRERLFFRRNYRKRGSKYIFREYYIEDETGKRVLRDPKTNKRLMYFRDFSKR